MESFKVGEKLIVRLLQDKHLRIIEILENREGSDWIKVRISNPLGSNYFRWIHRTTYTKKYLSKIIIAKDLDLIKEIYL